jgi:hypothetical protein
MADLIIMELAQRIATLEALAIQGKEDRDSIKESVEKLSEKLSPMIDKMNKWEAKFGAFFFIVGCVWTFFLATWKYILGVIDRAANGVLG